MKKKELTETLDETIEWICEKLKNHIEIDTGYAETVKALALLVEIRSELKEEKN